MTWATPLLAGIAAAIAIPALIILYFLKLRRRDVEISSTLLWKKAIQDLQANAPFQKLRRNLLLFLQLLVLAAVLLALAQPEIKGDTLQGQRHIILIDRSASMSAQDGGDNARTRLEEAKARALALVDSLKDGGLFLGGAADEAMVIAFSTTAEVRQQFTSDRALLRRTIEAIEPTDAPSLLDEAMRLARAHAPRLTIGDIAPGEADPDAEIEGLYRGQGATIHLFSDGTLPDAAEVLPANTDTVVYHAVGQPDAANVGITALRSQRDYETPEELSIFVSLESTGRTPRTVDVQLSLSDTDVIAVKRVELPAAARSVQDVLTPDPGPATPADPDDPDAPDTRAPVVVERWEPASTGVVFNLTRADPAMFSVRILPVFQEGSTVPPDVLPTDDVAWLAVPPARQLAVAIVSAGNIFLRGLEGLPLARLDTHAPDAWNALPAATRAEYDVVILDRWLPNGPLPPGRYLVLGAAPTTDTGIIDRGPSDASTAGVILDWRRDHPVMADLILDAIQIARPRAVELVEDAPTIDLADATFGPAILEFSKDQTRAIIVPFDPVASTWPFDVSWVVFLAAAVDYLGNDAGLGAGARQIQPGSVLSDRLPPGATAAELSLPGGRTIAIEPAADGRIVYGPINDTGIYALRWTGPASAGDISTGTRPLRAYAANLAEPAETEVGARTVLPLANQIAVAADSSRAAGIHRYWPWLILAALSIMLFEWYIYNRKVYL